MHPCKCHDNPFPFLTITLRKTILSPYLGAVGRTDWSLHGSSNSCIHPSIHSSIQQPLGTRDIEIHPTGSTGMLMDVILMPHGFKSELPPFSVCLPTRVASLSPQSGLPLLLPKTAPPLPADPGLAPYLGPPAGSAPLSSSCQPTSLSTV